jgi:hypothetical protein
MGFWLRGVETCQGFPVSVYWTVALPVASYTFAFVGLAFFVALSLFVMRSLIKALRDKSLLLLVPQQKGVGWRRAGTSTCSVVVEPIVCVGSALTADQAGSCGLSCLFWGNS